jgi:hypothetical protein
MTARKGLLARVAIDHEALLDFKDVSRTSINTHRTVTRLLADFAVIELRGPNDQRAVYGAVDQLSTDMKTLWSKLFGGLDTFNRLRLGDRTRKRFTISSSKETFQLTFEPT